MFIFKKEVADCYGTSIESLIIQVEGHNREIKLFKKDSNTYILSQSVIDTASLTTISQKIIKKALPSAIFEDEYVIIDDIDKERLNIIIEAC